MNERESRRIVAERSGGMCELCGSVERLTVHHRRKKSHLSKDQMWNPAGLVAVCGDGVRKCHGWCESFPIEAARLGFHCRPWETPADVPIRLYAHGWVRLLPDGGFVESEPREQG